eukprot:1120830-Pelagomonas_calceolata.AAC.1
MQDFLGDLRYRQQKVWREVDVPRAVNRKAVTYHQRGGPRIKSLWPGWRKYALCWWEPLGGSFLNARGRTASIDISLSFFSF